ncbi:MAG: Gfo/Idh/MocA family oxidoreductase, partial [Pirellulaceae bacterium]
MTKATPSKTGSRRDFIKKSTILVAGSTVAGNLQIARAAHPYGDETIKIGLVGCGGRGTGAAVQAMNTNGEVNIVAMADVFDDRLQGSYRAIKSKHGDKVKVTEETMFTGLDAYKQVLEADIDLIILATPPGFRPLHFEAAVNAGVHVFMEKPVATDAPGVRRVLDANKIAVDKNLCVQVGLQRRHEPAYIETIARLKDGAIGDINLGRVYWNGGGVWVRPRQDGQSELEYQMRNWYY